MKQVLAFIICAIFDHKVTYKTWKKDLGNSGLAEWHSVHYCKRCGVTIEHRSDIL